MPLRGSGGVWEKDIREAVRKNVVLKRGKLYVLVRTHDPQHDAHRNRELTPCRITHDLRCGKLILLPTSLKFATVCRNNVLHPLRLAAVGERDDEAVRRSKYVDGCTVDLAGLSSDMGQDAEAGKPACE